MNKIYQVYQVSDSTGETLDRIFLAIKSQFTNFEYKTIHHSFTRTKNQADKIISKCKNEDNSTSLSAGSSESVRTDVLTAARVQGDMSSQANSFKI